MMVCGGIRSQTEALHGFYSVKVGGRRKNKGKNNKKEGKRRS